MSNKEAEDLRLIMACIKHSDQKLTPDFEKVAKDIGAKNRNAAYQRHWLLMTKYGLTGGTFRGRKSASSTPAKPTPNAPDSGKKLAGNKRKATEQREFEEDDYDDVVYGEHDVKENAGRQASRKQALDKMKAEADGKE